MKNVSGFYCSRCRCEAPLCITQTGIKCPQCLSSLELKMNLTSISDRDKSIIKGKPRGHFRWKEFLPVHENSKLVTLGEGDTPLISAGQLGLDLDLPQLFFKAEYMLPTGSLKDRPVSVVINHALSVDANAVAVASTGNHAASVAAYASAAGLKSYIFIPEKTDLAKINQAAIHGAQVICVKGNMEEIGKLLRHSIDFFGWYPCTSSNPFRNEGKKTVAYEVWEQLEEQAPDFMIHPMGGGIGLWGSWKGWKELKQLKWVSQIPKMVGGQSVHATPIVTAWDQNSEDAAKVNVSETCAESIALGSIESGVGYRTLEALRDSKGTCVSLTDIEILQARETLARRAGIFVEPSAATSFAALIKLKQRNQIQSHHRIVCVLTGQGLKQKVSSDENIKMSLIDPDFKQLEKLVSSMEKK